LRKKRKIVVRRAEVEIFAKSQSASLALLVRSAAPTYAGFGVAQRKFSLSTQFL